MNAELRRIRLVVLDWAGTTVDYGAMARAEACSRVLKDRGIECPAAEIRRLTDLSGTSPVREFLRSGTGTRLFCEAKGRSWNEADARELGREWFLMLSRIAPEYSAPIPGVAEAVRVLRDMGLRIASTTDFPGELLQRVLPAARDGGYKPDCTVTTDVTGSSRPAPFMIFECMRRMNIYPPEAVVKVGDTADDMREGKNAGAQAIGILCGSGILGLSKEEYLAMKPQELAKRKQAAVGRYRSAGADMVINTILDLPAAIAHLDEMLCEEDLRKAAVKGKIAYSPARESRTA